MTTDPTEDPSTARPEGSGKPKLFVRGLAGYRPADPESFGRSDPSQRRVPIKGKKGSHCQQPKGGKTRKKRKKRPK